jgi:S1-C subfamily serine protease
VARLVAAPVVLALAALSVALWPAGSSPEDSVVEVIAAGCGPRAQRASGVVVASERVATTAHTVAGARELAVRGPGRSPHEARLLVLDVERDLALLHVPALGARALPSGETTAGQTGRVLGYGPSRLEPRPFRLIRRIRARTTDLYGERTVERDALEIAAEIDPGDSGAALVNDDGDVLGIVFAASRSREGTAYAVAASELERLTPTPFAPVVAGRCP